MKIKTIFPVALLCFFSFTILPVSAETDPVITGKEPADTKQLTKQEFEKAYETLKERTHALKEARKHARTKLEKQKINAEIKGIKEEAKALKEQLSGGVYIGSGVLLVIILLILLL